MVSRQDALPVWRQPARDDTQHDMLDDEVGEPRDGGEQQEAKQGFGPGRQMAEEGQGVGEVEAEAFGRKLAHGVVPAGGGAWLLWLSVTRARWQLDRKSTRLNSSH